MNFRAIVVFDAIVRPSQRILTGRPSSGSVSGRETELAPDQIRVVAGARALLDTHLTVRRHDSILHGQRYAPKFVPVTRLAIGTKAKPDQDRHSGGVPLAWFPAEELPSRLRPISLYLAPPINKECSAMAGSNDRPRQTTSGFFGKAAF